VVENEKDNPAESEETGFRIADRRKFTPDGEIRQQDEEPAAEEAAQPDDTGPAEGAPSDQSEGREAEADEEADRGRTIDFTSFLLSLATTAMAHLGDVPDPGTGETSENLEAAQQMIDILSLLKEKTQGNLEPDEVRLIDDLLYELRMRFLSKAKVIQT
jgi:hypothetical protein